MAGADNPAELVQRAQRVMAHAWMVRTFVKHCEEAEEFPELHQVVRAVFDSSRALETRADDPAGYFRMLQKKIGKLRTSSVQFAADVQRISTHTNFQQSVISLSACIDDL